MLLHGIILRFILGSLLLTALAVYWHYRPNKTPKIVSHSWKYRWSVVVKWIMFPYIAVLVILSLIYLVNNNRNTHRSQIISDNTGLVNLVHFNRIALGLESAGNYENTPLAKLALDLKPLLAQDKDSNNIPDNIANFKVFSDKYVNVSNWFSICAFQVTSSNDNNSCDDHGNLSGNMQRNLLDAIQGDTSAIQLPDLALPKKINTHRGILDLCVNLVFLDWIFSIVLVALIDWEGKATNRQYLEILDGNLDTDGEVEAKITSLMFNPYLLIAFAFMHIKLVLSDTEFAKAFKLGQRNKTINKVEFANELKEAYILRDKLFSFEPTEEVLTARKFVAATIDTLQEVPKIKKRDEQRIQAVNMMKEAKRLLVPAETNLEAHQELMRAYHDEQIKMDLKELLPKKTPAWDSETKEWT